MGRPTQRGGRRGSRAGRRTREPALVGAAGALTLWTLGRFVFVPPWGMALLLLATAVAGLLLLLPGTRRRWARLGGGGLLASSLLFLVAVFRPPAGPASVIRRVATPPEPTDSLRLIDWNVLHGFPTFRGQGERYDRLEAALAALDPTVVLLQEAWSVAGHGELATRLGEALDMDVAYVRANGSRSLLGFEEGSAILSRLPIREARGVVLEPRRPWWEKRVALRATLELGGGRALEVISIHLVAGDLTTAAAQAERLAAGLDVHRDLIVAGDLNAPSGSAAARAFEQRGLRELLPGGIDHVFLPVADSAWRVVGVGWTLRPAELEELIGDGAAVSDHPAILVDLERKTQRERR